ncbi:uncharacterized protein PGTG_10194 [Puccinia graminis f. sp. tritici CRL 75-36-700-3]|uniref:Uncharacterized protein n=1 Tax=Puccinia graminis f. sp. tritici (strain CRL 75-36-700-3 / race SCCL) TaxID=418459 RepID=E3KJJ9_PUCGT|nr:uncharacterized protein PGTG_10194 [Puccinia graminis f. sp. tritici CRL 75-36-700-3]EFP84474.2 hypothetical protein PGTG_10194 [Puccinia graminis f. sp. tritici CRL 75-36-700-3]
MHDPTKKGKKKKQDKAKCNPTRHHPDFKSHTVNKFWKLHPELRSGVAPAMAQAAAKAAAAPATQLVEVDYGHKLNVSLLLSEATNKPIFLNSGATHHMINNPDVFQPISVSNMKLLNGGHSNFLNTTSVGTAEF